ncbi:MAG TPA: aminomethyl-transferring glycine dehydrogenase [Bacteroidales bacterium]|nr:aminomethyl-transferring glycine dehydrogenase [Bacteroidales bacterium]HPQ62650.1 aminomethyl-transferring glycine dehydrogenase [Bacteroidales bacterium]
MLSDHFVNRHIGPRDSDVAGMCRAIGVDSTEQLIDQTVPAAIRLNREMNLPPAMSEYEYLAHIRELGKRNSLFRSFIGQGYYGVATLPVIVRNVLENPAWYTSYTPYQAEISQGRLEALLNFQTMVSSLTAMDIANASLLDESTAAAEAMIMMYNARSRDKVKAGANLFLVDNSVFMQTRDVLITRAAPLGIDIQFIDYTQIEPDEQLFGVVVQYPAANGEIRDYRELVEKVHGAGALAGVGADLMSLTLLTPPGEWGADIVFGSNQRFGLPMSYGGPHAGFFAVRDDLKRNMPGRLIGVSVDARGKQALRMALQTREQHIKRERATSNICTAQALLATMSGMYAQYHGPEGLKRIGRHIFSSACTLAGELKKLGYTIRHEQFFDTIRVQAMAGVTADMIRKIALERGINLWYPCANCALISTDEVTTLKEVNILIGIFAEAAGKKADEVTSLCDCFCIDEKFHRKSAFLQERTFNSYHSETDMMRYIKMLERKDFSLANGMIPLGSCTMKLNPAASMFAMSWPEFGNIHPFVPADQAAGYHKVMEELGEALKEITGFDAVSFQPNSGAAGEYAGLMVIRQYHISRNEGHRNVALIPSSAHGTNPASAAMAGMKVVVVECDENGNISVDDLKKKAVEHRDNLSSAMITYPSTHGVFEEAIIEMISIVHENGGLVYMDGANMNAQVGLTSPGHIGADVCHLNLHKTFAIPHGGGGPGMGPILCNTRLAEFLPSHPVVKTGGSHGITAVAAAPYGSAHVLTISHAYVMMLGAEGLTKSTIYAILNANYLSSRLGEMYKVLYTGANDRCAHEMILDCRGFRDAGVDESDIAKRLMDYGFHAPTLSFPVHGTLMVEPTESEPKAELDRFIDAMRNIWKEIDEIRKGEADREDNVLKNAPHTAAAVIADEWNHGYQREKAAFPLPWVVENKFWPATGRVDNGYGDRNLVCTCAPVDSYRFESFSFE